MDGATQYWSQAQINRAGWSQGGHPSIKCMPKCGFYTNGGGKKPSLQEHMEKDDLEYRKDVEKKKVVTLQSTKMLPFTEIQREIKKMYTECENQEFEKALSVHKHGNEKEIQSKETKQNINL